MQNVSLSADIQMLWNFDLGAVTERALIESPELAGKYPQYEHELRKFFSLIAQGEQPLAMISPRIDALWHSFITFTPLYREFCERVFGFYVDHLPRTSRTPIPEVAIWNFFERYERSFGDVPPLWFDGLSASTVDDLKEKRVPSSLRWSGWVPRNTNIGGC